MLLHSKKVLGSLAVLSMLALAGPAMAQTTTGSTTGTGYTTTSVTSSTTPGAPNTGAGGDTTQNLLLLGLSGLVVVAGGAYLARKGATAR